MSGSSPVHVAWLHCHHDKTGHNDPVVDKSIKVNEMKDLKTMAPVALLMLLVFAAMGVMVFWGVSLLDLSEQGEVLTVR
jgi:hypothetical protein